MYAVMIVFFLANAIEGQLISTGAFEVELNGKYSPYAVRLTSLTINIQVGFSFTIHAHV